MFASDRVLVLGNKIADQVDGKQAIVSGAIKVWLRDAEQSESLVLMTPDVAEFTVGRSPVSPITPGIDAMDAELARRFNGSGGWQALHAPSYSDHYPRAILSEMMEAAGVTASPTDQVENLHRLLAVTEQPRQIEDDFIARYSEPFSKLLAGNKVHIEGYKTHSMLSVYAPQLAAQGCETIVRVHEAISDRITETSWGRNFIEGLSQVSKVRTHTDRDLRALETAFDQLKCPQRPDLGTYRLGIDFSEIERAVKTVTPENYTTAIPGYGTLNQGQKSLISTLMSTRHTIPHRFLSIDALDPIKGALQAYQTAERVLETAMERGTLKDYLFAFVQSGRFPSDKPDPFNMNTAYARYVMEERERIANKFPGSVIICDAIRGDASRAIASLAVNCHPYSGGSFEGLNLAWQEMIYANYLVPTSSCLGVLPRGAGFAEQVVENRNGHLGYFPAAANVDEMVDAIHEVCQLQKQNPHRLRQRLEQLVKLEVLNRTASLFDL